MTKNPCKTLPSAQIYESLSEEEAEELWPVDNKFNNNSSDFTNNFTNTNNIPMPNCDNTLILPAKALDARWVVDRHAGADCDGDDALVIDCCPETNPAGAELLEIIRNSTMVRDDDLLETVKREVAAKTAASNSSSTAGPVLVTEDELEKAIRIEIRDDILQAKLLPQTVLKWTYLADKFGAQSPEAHSYGYFCELAVDQKMRASYFSSARGDANKLKEITGKEWAPQPTWYAAYKKKKLKFGKEKTFDSQNSMIARLFREVTKMRNEGVPVFQRKVRGYISLSELEGATVQEMWRVILKLEDSPEVLA